jgi:pilus assembly protein CpaF
MEEIFAFQYDEVNYGEVVRGKFTTEGIMQRSQLVKKAHFYGLYDELMQSFRGEGS